MAKAKEPAATLYAAIIRGELSTVNKILADGVPQIPVSPSQPDLSALHFAIDQRKTAIARLLIEKGADLNHKTTQFGRTPMIDAAREGNIDVLRALIAAGADIHAIDNNGWTALDHAAKFDGSAAGPMVEAAIEAGGDPNRLSKTWGSPLIKACWKGHVSACSALVAKKAQVNLMTEAGTPLLQAVDGRRADVIPVLLAAGADPNLRFEWSDSPRFNKDYIGKTPLELARERKLKKIVAVLEDPAAAKSAMAGVAEPTAADVPAMWTRLEAALSKADEGNAEFAGPATVEQLAALETKTGLMLPDDLKASYGVHDGQDESSEGIYASGDFLDGAFYLMSLEQIANEWSMWKKLVDGGEFRGQESAPDDGIRSDCWNPGWLPILSDGGGDSLCVDLAPTARGVRGQIIKMSHDSAQRPLLARSFAGFLAQLIDSWEAKSET